MLVGLVVVELIADVKLAGSVEPQSADICADAGGPARAQSLHAAGEQPHAFLDRPLELVAIDDFAGTDDVHDCGSREVADAPFLERSPRIFRSGDQTHGHAIPKPFGQARRVVKQEARWRLQLASRVKRGGEIGQLSEVGSGLVLELGLQQPPARVDHGGLDIAVRRRGEFYECPDCVAGGGLGFDLERLNQARESTKAGSQNPPVNARTAGDSGTPGRASRTGRPRC
jgi:hypothetical protein